MIDKSVIRNALITILAITGGLTLTFFFLTSFGRAGQDIKTTNVTISEAQCQGKCQALIALGYNYKTCSELLNNKDAMEYKNQCKQECKVVIKDSIVCKL